MYPDYFFLSLYHEHVDYIVNIFMDHDEFFNIILTDGGIFYCVDIL